MESVRRPQHLPDFNRLSTIAVVILLTYVLGRWIRLPGRELAIQLPGVYFSVQITTQTMLAFLVACLTVLGAEWLVRDHPGLTKQATLEHWLLPGLTAWVVEFSLFQLSIGFLWWIALFAGGVLLTLVLVAEYIAVDDEDLRHPLAASVLTVVSFALYLILAASLRFAGLRLFLLLPALTLASVLVSLRALHLRLHGRWAYAQAFLVAFVTVQFAAALHYWPISPVSFGLALLGPAYSITNLVGNLAEGENITQAIVEPLIILAFLWGVAFWMH